MLLRAGEPADGSMGAPVDEAGRGLATSAAERTNFESPAAGAWGTTILRKQVGQLSCPPLVLESAVMCWPQTGHANLNSLIGCRQTIPQSAPQNNPFLWATGKRTDPSAAPLL